MKFRLIWVRSNADAELGAVADRYLNRIRHFFPIEVIEITPGKGGQSAKDAAIIRARDSARLLGIDAATSYRLAFGIASALAAVAGILIRKLGGELAVADGTLLVRLPGSAPAVS